MSSKVSSARIFILGSGPSERVPLISCLTNRAEGPNACHVCLSTLNSTPENRSRNIRRNISALLQIFFENDTTKNILFDCGKSSYNAMQEFFPSLKVKKLDAVILTHCHADAVFGLDDLRDWSSAEVHPDGLPVYLRQENMNELKQIMPWLCGTPTGSGFVPKLAYKIIEDQVPFLVDGTEGALTITPYTVPHGNNCTAAAFKFGNVSFVSDTHHLPEHVIEALKETQTLILDGIWPEQYPKVLESYDFSLSEKPDGVTAIHHRPKAHLTLPMALEYCHQMNNRNVVFIGANHYTDYYFVSERLKEYSAANPKGKTFELAYDGMSIPVLL